MTGSNKLSTVIKTLPLKNQTSVPLSPSHLFVIGEGQSISHQYRLLVNVSDPVGSDQVRIKTSSSDKSKKQYNFSAARQHVVIVFYVSHCKQCLIEYMDPGAHSYTEE